MPRAASSPRRESSPERTVLAAVQSRQFASVYYLTGDDEFRKEAAVQDLLNAALDSSTREFNCEIRRGGELDAEDINDLLGTPPMFAERRAVVIRDVGSLKKAARAGLDRYLERPAGDTLLLLLTPASAKIDDALVAQSEPLVFEPLPPERVSRWISHQVTTVLGAIITDDAIQDLQRVVGNDLQALAGELDKCASYALGMQEAGVATTTVTIDGDAVAAVVGVRRGETVTDLLDAVLRHDAKVAMDIIPHVLAQPKMSGVLAVIMLSSQAFALAFGRARREAGVPTNKLPGEFFGFLKEVGGNVGRPWGEATSAWTKHVDGWSTQSCQRALELLLEADIMLKESTISNENQVLTNLVLALCSLKPRSRRVA